jgi:protein-disulfide isomerase
MRENSPVTVTRIFVAMMLGIGLAAAAAPAPAQWNSEPGSDFKALISVLEEIKGEIKGLRQDMKAMQADLARKPPAAQRQVPTTANVSIDGDPMLGSADAPLTLVEFSDYQCPFCRRFFDNTLPALKKEFIDTGKLRYVFRDFPLDRIHKQARKAAEAARCAGAQGEYWAMHDLLFKNNGAMAIDDLKRYARLLDGMDGVAFDACLDQGKYAAEVQKGYRDGAAAGVRGTPGFVLGKPTAEGTIQGIFIRGARPASYFRTEIERLLAQTGKKVADNQVK